MCFVNARKTDISNPWQSFQNDSHFKYQQVFSAWLHKDLTGIMLRLYILLISFIVLWFYLMIHLTGLVWRLVKLKYISDKYSEVDIETLMNFVCILLSEFFYFKFRMKDLNQIYTHNFNVRVLNSLLRFSKHMVIC